MHRRSYVSGQGFTWKNEISYASIRYMCILYAHEIRASALKSQSRFYLEKGNSVHYDTFKTTNSMFHLSRTEINHSIIAKLLIKYCEKQAIQKDVSGKNCTMSRRIYCDDFSTSYKAHVEDCNFLLYVFVAYIQTIAKHCKLAYFVSYYPLSSYEFKNSMCHRH